MATNLIEIEDLGKRYQLGQRLKYGRFTEAAWDTLRNLGRGRSAPTDHLWALRHISFGVSEGQVMGVIGRNGAGKSTLLKLLSNVTRPTEGRARLYGRVGALLEVGTGFHPELTGRDNVFLNGAILGMKRTEIRRKFDEIVEFAEVSRFIDTPVKRFSSGMKVRLAFAVAAHLDPEILIVDEVLAVGDLAFQRKCLGKMDDVAHEGRTVLFVSHNMGTILRLCETSLLLDEGRLSVIGPTREVVDRYMATAMSSQGERVWDETSDSNPDVKLRAVRIRNSRGAIADLVSSTESFTIESEYEVVRPIRDLRVSIRLYTSRGELLFSSFDTDDLDNYETHSVRKEGIYTSACEIPADLLNAGHFVVGTSAGIYNVTKFFDHSHALSFAVDTSGGVGSQWPEATDGPFRPGLRWKVERAE